MQQYSHMLLHPAPRLAILIRRLAVYTENQQVVYDITPGTKVKDGFIPCSCYKPTFNTNLLVYVRSMKHLYSWYHFGYAIVIYYLQQLGIGGKLYIPAAATH